jgi:hypothetical protein
MFQRNRRRGLKQALDEASDVELRGLREKVAERQDRVAQLEAELAETREEISRFEKKLDSRLGSLELRLESLNQKLDELRRNAERNAQWGERADSPDIPEDVVEQFRRAWTQTESQEPDEPEEQELPQAEKEELKSVFRKLAKRFHPDLVVNPQEKQSREAIMVEVNQAYSDKNLKALLVLMDRPDQAVETVEKTRDEEVNELYAEAHRLDDIVQQLEFQLKELVNSPTMKIMLDVSMARNSGRDMLAEMAKELLDRIFLVEGEIAALR